MLGGRLPWPYTFRQSACHGSRAIYAATPSLPTLKPRPIIATGDMVVAELDYHSSDDFMAVFMFRLRNGKIIYQIAYWTQPFPAPDWRTQWVEHK